MHFLPGLTLLLTISLSAAHAAVEQTESAVQKELCAAGRAEGTYDIQLSANSKFRVNILCTGPDSMAASMRNLDTSDVSYSLVFTAIDADMINFVTFKVSAEDAKSLSSRNLDARLKLRLDSLRQGVLEGYYMALNRTDPVAVSGVRETPFPNLLARTQPMHSPLSYPAAFDVKHDKLNAVLVLDVVGGIQRINIHLEGSGSYVLYDGLSAGAAGDVFYATSGVDDSTSGRINLQHVRGRVLSAHEIEFYFLDTAKGMLGPFRAQSRPVQK